MPETRRFSPKGPYLRVISGLLALFLLISGCGDACVGFTSFTDANGLIVLVDCDGRTFVVTPTPGAR